ncbi:MAG: hypothetical protein HQ483_12695 [Rhodospirillales bacterium]|nr:hypothetical protein [Rhodospirillales bacterium]
MHAVFVNHCHPDMGHVCALRLRKFAEAMAARGHRIVLLTESLDAAETPIAPDRLAERLQGHDWNRPFYLAVQPLADGTLASLRGGAMNRWRRAWVVLSRYLFEGGLYGGWEKAAAPYLPVLATAFRPDIVWASFGNTAVWNIGRAVASAAKCPWVADIKDNWRRFIPRGLRRLLAVRYRDAAAMTTFSRGQALEAGDWFAARKSVIYSGFDEADIGPADAPAKPDGAFEILITGSLYGAREFQVFTDALTNWMTAQKRTQPDLHLRLIYAGNDHLRAEPALRPLAALCSLDIRPFMALAELLAAQRRADLNVYIRWPGPFIFHHKTVELLSAEKPILCYPPENDEACQMVAGVGGVLYSCATQQQIEAALSQAFADRASPAEWDRAALTAYSWQGQAAVLEEVLEGARRQP